MVLTEFLCNDFSALPDQVRREVEVLKLFEMHLKPHQKYERAIAIMYDLSGLKRSGEDCSQLIDDWKYLVDSVKVTNQKGAKTYLFLMVNHSCYLGVGFPDRPYNIRNIGLLRLIDFLKNDPVYGGCSVMLGFRLFGVIEC